MERSAGIAHVAFNSAAQALASRIVRQWDKRLSMLGVVHTHPGSLRHPSDGDFRGDSQWVGRLRGGEGIFGIGTADGHFSRGPLVARQPQPHQQCLQELCLSWYALKEGDSKYHPLEVCLTLGPDLARPLHDVWPILESHVEELDRLCRQQAGITFAVSSTEDEGGAALVATLPLAESGSALRLVLERKQTRYFLVRGDDLHAIDPLDSRIDCSVYLLLAELAGLD